MRSTARCFATVSEVAPPGACGSDLARSELVSKRLTQSTAAVKLSAQPGRSHGRVRARHGRRRRCRDASVMPAVLPEVGKPCKAGLSGSRSVSGILRTRVAHAGSFRHGYAESRPRPKSPNAAKWRARDAPVMPRLQATVPPHTRFGIATTLFHSLGDASSMEGAPRWENHRGATGSHRGSFHGWLASLQRMSRFPLPPGFRRTWFATTALTLGEVD